MSHTERQDVTYYSGHVIEVNGKRYAKERISQLRYDEVHRDYVCSTCGVWLSLDSYQRETENGAVYRRFKHCPECGARVIEEER